MSNVVCRMSRKKGEEISGVGENLSRRRESKSLKSRLIQAVPILAGFPLGARNEKAFRIQPVRISINLSASRFTLNASRLPTIVKMLQFFEQYVVCSISYVGGRNPVFP